MQRLDDMEVALPEFEEPEESPSFSDNHQYFEHFRQMCSLSLLKGRIYSEIYCPKRDVKHLDFCRKVRELNAELEKWWENLQLKDLPNPVSETKDFLAAFAWMTLRIVYCNCLIMTHRIIPRFHYLATHNLEWRSGALYHDLASLEAQLPLSTAACLGAARDTLQLVHHIPWSNTSWIW